MLDERPAWHTRAACFSIGQDVFYEDDPTEARKHCQACPIRRTCLDAAMTLEAGAAIINRHGINAGLTPAQRYSLEKRGNAHCSQCGTMFDPLAHLDGWLVCDECGHELTVTQLPEAGDAWQDRHTELARRIVAWLVENIELGAQVPKVKDLAQTLKARLADVTRVYEALGDDGTLVDHGDGVPVRARSAGVVPWQPPHLS